MAFMFISMAVQSKASSAACWDCGFESRRRRAYLSVVTVVSYQVETSATGRSLIQRIPTEYGVSECDLVTLRLGGPGPLGGCRVVKNVDMRNADLPHNK